jgi:hypothetical protein
MGLHIRSYAVPVPVFVLTSERSEMVRRHPRNFLSGCSSNWLPSPTEAGASCFCKCIRNTVDYGVIIPIKNVCGERYGTNKFWQLLGNKVGMVPEQVTRISAANLSRKVFTISLWFPQQIKKIQHNLNMITARIFRKVCHIVNYACGGLFVLGNNSRSQRQSLPQPSGCGKDSLTWNGEQTKALLNFFSLCESVRVKIRLLGNSKYDSAANIHLVWKSLGSIWRGRHCFTRIEREKRRNKIETYSISHFSLYRIVF